jgi:muramidase (phage lysozyme)
LPDSAAAVSNVLGDMAGKYVPIPPPAPQSAPPAMSTGMAAPAAPPAQLPQPHVAPVAGAPDGAWRFGTDTGMASVSPDVRGSVPAPPHDPLAAVRQTIATGESGGSDPYHETYGGGHFGWQGEPNTGSGRYGFVKSTWNTASKAWLATNPGQPAPDFNKPGDQDKIFNFWATRTYGTDEKGRNLEQAAAAGDVDYSRLAGQWPSLMTTGVKAAWSTLAPQEEETMRTRTAKSEEIANNLTGMMLQYSKEAAEAPPGSKERDELISKYRKNLEDMQAEWRQKVASPPVEKPVDAWQNFGSPAVILGLLGGLFARQHLTAGLGAAASALTAINENNHEQFEKSYQTWKTQTELGLNMIHMQNDDIRSLIDDKKMAIDEKNSRLQTLAAEMGMAEKIGSLPLDNLDSFTKLLTHREDTAATLELRKAELESLNAYRQLRAAGGFGKLSRPQTFEWQDEQGNSQKKTVQQAPDGSWRDLKGNPTDIPVDAQPITPSAGRQEATQINAMISAGNEAIGELNNLRELPIGATTGFFAGVGRDARTTAEAWSRAFGSVLSSEDSKDVRTSALGIQRELASIEASGRSTGLVGLQRLNDEALPMVGDSGEVVLRKYAQIRQVIERNIHMILAKSNIDPGQRKGLEENLDEVKKAIPFTVHQVNEMKKRLRSGSPESVADYAKRMIGGDQGEAPEVTREQYDNLPAGAPYRVPGNPTTMYKQ